MSAGGALIAFGLFLLGVSAGAHAERRLSRREQARALTLEAEDWLENR